MRKWLVSGILGAFCVVVCAASVALAATSTPQPAQSAATPGQGLEISPPVVELDANPGQTVTTQIRVRDVTQGTLDVHGTVDDFGAGSEEGGQPQILLNESGATRFSLKYWVTGVPNLTLGPGELKTTTITIQVPSNAEPGGHYGVVRFTGVPPSMEGTGVALSASVGTLILFTVNGNITHNLSVADFATGVEPRVDIWSPMSFFEHGPVGFLVRTHNTGSVHEMPKGSITITNMFGRKDTAIAVNATGGNVLPDSYRRFYETWSEKELFGHYTAALALTYDGNKSLSEKISFWVIPWKLILLVLLGLVVIGYLMKVGIKRYNEHIIAMARRR